MIKKLAETEVEIAPLISERWSPRVFDPEFIINEVSVKSILEAARWAPSCFGDQPWKFIIFQKKDALQWVNALNCLSVGNQNWAMDTSLLIAFVRIKNLSIMAMKINGPSMILEQHPKIFVFNQHI